MKTSNTQIILFNLTWISWTTVTIFFMIEPTMSAISYVVVVSLIFSTILGLKYPLLCLYLLPLPMMIGPVMIYPVPSIGAITVGDVYASVLIFRSLFMRFGHIKKNNQEILFACILLLVISTIFSTNFKASFVGLVKILQFALLVRVSMILITEKSYLRNLYNSWALITTLCTIMMLWHFYNGRPQMIYWNNDLGIADVINLDRYDVLFRPTFFYANFWIPLGLSIIYSVLTFFDKTEKREYIKMLLLLAAPVNLFALLVNNSRAMLVPILVLLAIIIIIKLWITITKQQRNIRRILLLLLIISICVRIFSELLITPSQKIALLERSNNSESVLMRLSVWENVFKKTLDDPIRLLVGWGPQSTSRQLEESDMQSLLTGILGNVEGAFDSTII